MSCMTLAGGILGVLGVLTGVEVLDRFVHGFGRLFLIGKWDWKRNIWKTKVRNFNGWDGSR